MWLYNADFKHEYREKQHQQMVCVRFLFGLFFNDYFSIFVGISFDYFSFFSGYFFCYFN